MTTALDAALDRARITDPSERQRLHEVLADPEVSVPLSAAHRRYRRRMGIYLAALVASVVPAFMYGAGLLDAMPPEPSFGAGLLFAVFAFVPCTIAFIVVSAMSRDTELKSVIVRKLLWLLHPGVSYSPDAAHAFDFDHLVDAGLLSGYDRIDKREDSMKFEMRQDGRLLRVHGFELRTSRRHKDKNGTHWSVADSCYLLRGEYPDIRFPISSPVLVSADISDSPIWSVVFFAIPFAFIFPNFPTFETALVGMGIFGDSSVPVWFPFVCSAALAFVVMRGLRAWRNRHRARMESVAFEKLFDVRCEDQVLARQVLTPALMDRLVRFAGEHRGSYEFLFSGREVYLKKAVRGEYLESARADVGDVVGWYADLRESVALVADTGMLAFSRTIAEPEPAPTPSPSAALPG